MKTFLMTGSTGDTGTPTVKYLLEQGHRVKALVRREDERGHGGQAYPLHGPIEYSHQELANLLGETLGKDVRYEQVFVEDFVKQLGVDSDPAFAVHFNAVKIDQREKRLEGLDSTDTTIIGQALLTPAQFIGQHRLLLA